MEPSERVYTPAVRQQLREAEDQIARGFEKIGRRHFGAHLTPRKRLAIDADVRALVDRALPEGVPRYLMRFSEDAGRVVAYRFFIPLYLHDCDACTYLGRHEQDGGKFDLYTCTVHTITPRTVVARYGDEGPDYISMPAGPLRGMVDVSLYAPLKEALRRWDADQVLR